MPAPVSMQLKEFQILHTAIIAETIKLYNHTDDGFQGKRESARYGYTPNHVNDKKTVKSFVGSNPKVIEFKEELLDKAISDKEKKKIEGEFNNLGRYLSNKFKKEETVVSLTSIHSVVYFYALDCEDYDAFIAKYLPNEPVNQTEATHFVAEETQKNIVLEFQAWYFSVRSNEPKYFTVKLFYGTHKAIATGWYDLDKKEGIERNLDGEFRITPNTIYIDLHNKEREHEFKLIIRTSNPPSARNFMRFMFTGLTSGNKPFSLQGVMVKVLKVVDEETQMQKDELAVPETDMLLLKKILTLRRDYLYIKKSNDEIKSIDDLTIRDAPISMLLPLTSGNKDNTELKFRILGIDSNGRMFQSRLIVNPTTFVSYLHTAIGESGGKQRIIFDITKSIHQRIVIYTVPEKKWGTICNWILNLPIKESMFTSAVFTHVGSTHAKVNNIVNGFLVLWEDMSDFDVKTFNKTEIAEIKQNEDVTIKAALAELTAMVRQAHTQYDAFLK
jgi:hypothetical protein